MVFLTLQLFHLCKVVFMLTHHVDWCCLQFRGLWLYLIVVWHERVLPIITQNLSLLPNLIEVVSKFDLRFQSFRVVFFFNSFFDLSLIVCYWQKVILFCFCQQTFFYKLLVKQLDLMVQNFLRIQLRYLLQSVDLLALEIFISRFKLEAPIKLILIYIQIFLNHF